MYSSLSLDLEPQEQKKAKGGKKNVVKKEIKQRDYLNVLFNNKTMHHRMNTIRSESHQINSYHLNKVSLSPYDDKRYGIFEYEIAKDEREKNKIN